MLSILKWILSGLFSKYLVGVGIPGNASEWRIFFRKFQLLLLSTISHGHAAKKGSELQPFPHYHQYNWQLLL